MHGFSRPEPRGARRDHDPAGDRRRPCSTRCPTSAPAATRPGTRSATRVRSRPPPDRERPLTIGRPAAERGDRGRRLRRRLGRRRRRDRRRAGGGGQGRGRARDGRLLRRPRLRPARALGLPAHVPQRRPVPDRRGAGLGRRRQGVGGGTVVNWTNCLRTHDWVRDEWAREHGLEGLDGPEFDAHLDAVSERIQVNEDCSRPERPAPAARAGMRAAGYDFRGSPATPTAIATTRQAPPTWASATSRARSSRPRRPTSSTRRRTAPEILAGCRAERVLVEGGRASRGRGGVRRPRGAARRRRADPGRGPGADRGRRLRLDRVAGAAAALADRRAGGRRLPAPAPDRGGDRLLRRAAELVLGPAAGGALARVRRPRRRPRLPDRVRRRRPPACSPARCRGARAPTTSGG